MPPHPRCPRVAGADLKHVVEDSNKKLTEHADPQIAQRAKAALRQVRGREGRPPRRHSSGLWRESRYMF